MSELMEYKKVYNMTVTRIKKADEWFKTAPKEKIEDGLKRLEILLTENQKLINLINDKGYKMSSDEILEGFELDK